jgi:hypothetical protein
LDSRLNRLVEVKREGEAAACAEEQMIELVDSSVKVMVSHQPGQTEAFMKTVERFGSIDHITATSSELIAAIVPIISLTHLAAESNI